MENKMSNSNAIRHFLAREFLPDSAGEDIPMEFDLIQNGVIDSLGLLQVIAWIESDLGVQIDVEDMVPENFASVVAINALIERSASPVALQH
jgi:acyl carrier protein